MPGKILLLPVITLILLAGCMVPVPVDTPAEIPATGSVEVSSTPPGAEVYLDNVYKGTTPVTIIGQPGTHILELRLRDHQSWSKSIRIDSGSRIYLDTALAPVSVITSLPTPVLTTRSTTLPTTRPRPTTSPAPVTPAGCWMHEIVQVDFSVTYTYELDSGGSGWLTCKGMEKCLPPQELTWSRTPDPLDPEHSALVTIRVAGSPDHPVPLERVLTYDARTDTLAYGESDNHVLFLKRTPCSRNGLTIGAG